MVAFFKSISNYVALKILVENCHHIQGDMTVKRHVVVKRRDHRKEFRSLFDEKAEIDSLIWDLDEA